PVIRYIRKRSMQKRGPTFAVNIKLEELAKIRYAFLYEPTLVLSSPKDLWTPESDEGVYEKAFGVGGEVPEIWSEEEFRLCLTAIAFYLRIENSSKEETKNNPQLMFLKRLRYHALALAGVYITARIGSTQESKLVENKCAFEEVWSKIWNEVRRV